MNIKDVLDEESRMMLNAKINKANEIQMKISRQIFNGEDLGSILLAILMLEDQAKKNYSQRWDEAVVAFGALKETGLIQPQEIN